MIDPSITVTVPAVDRNLLTIAQLRAIAGVTDSSQDTTLTALGVVVSEAIVNACGVARDGAVPPTLMKESILQTTRLGRGRDGNMASDTRPLCRLILSRRPILSVTSVTEDGVVLDPSFYERRDGQGILIRLNASDDEIPWRGRKIVIAYDAGHATVPAGLVLAAQQYAQILFWQAGRDPRKQLQVSEAPDLGMSRSQWFHDAHEGAAIPRSIMDLLDAGGYVRPAF